MYSIYQQKLKDGITGKDIGRCNHLLKGDFSGIQEFIFSIPSKGAAKSLKAKSFYIQAIGKLCLEFLLSELSPFGAALLVDSGGSFIIEVKQVIPDDRIKELEALCNRIAGNENLYLTLTMQNAEADWHTTYKMLREKEQIAKLQKHRHNPNFFDPCNAQSDDATVSWKQLVGKLHQSNGYYVGREDKSGDSIVGAIGDMHYSIVEKSPQYPFNVEALPTSYIVKGTPVWRSDNPFIKSVREESKSIDVGDTIDLDYLGLQAEMRTGTDKIACVKLDVDGLGHIFREMARSKNAFIDIANATNYFFAFYLNQLLDRPWKDGWKYSDNILIVFSGGDDCLLIGAWDAALDFMLLVQSEFSLFAKESSLTLSAAYKIFNTSHPIVSLAEEMEDALYKAKKTEGKNSVTMFNEVFTWQLLRDAVGISKILVDLVKEGENKALIQRVRMSAIGYEKLQNSANNGIVNFQKVWNLGYYILRNVSDKNKERVDREIVQTYHARIMKTFTNPKSINEALIYPLGARIAELLTRKTN